MINHTFKLDIVSAEKVLFTGEAEFIAVTGVMGELGIRRGHAPLLTFLKPGAMQLHCPDKAPSWFYISGGILEVQPKIVTVLADVAERADDIDEAAALRAQQKAQKAMGDRQSGITDASIAIELAQAAARLRTIREIKRHKNR